MRPIPFPMPRPPESGAPSPALGRARAGAVAASGYSLTHVSVSGRWTLATQTDTQPGAILTQP
jgi:hypothetical protein